MESTVLHHCVVSRSEWTKRTLALKKAFNVCYEFHSQSRFSYTLRREDENVATFSTSSATSFERKLQPCRKIFFPLFFFTLMKVLQVSMCPTLSLMGIMDQWLA